MDPLTIYLIMAAIVAVFVSAYIRHDEPDGIWSIAGAMGCLFGIFWPIVLTIMVLGAIGDSIRILYEITMKR